jgi:PAS domain S-box-containing protein
MATDPNDIHSEAFHKATLQSECTRILVLLLVLAAVLAIVVIRALVARLPEQLQMLPRTVGLILVAVSYEGMMLVYIRWVIGRARDLPALAWVVNIGVETLFPTAAIIILTNSAYVGPYRALTAPAAHAYYFFIVLAALRLRPVLCFLTGLATAACFLTLTAYTFRTFPLGSLADAGAYPLQFYVTYGLFFLISSSAAAVVTARFRECVLAALREAETRRRFEELEREIAERRRAEAALVTSERRYRQLTEGTRDAIVVAGQDGLITLFNPAASEIFGYSESEVLGQPLTILTSPVGGNGQSGDLERHFKPLIDRTGHRAAELRGRRKDGELFPLELSLTSLDLPEGTVYLAAIRDASERRRLEARLIQSEKLASLGLLSAGVAHEINNPLAYISNNLALIERDIGSLKAAATACQNAQASVEPAESDFGRKLGQLRADVELLFEQHGIERILSSTRQGVRRVADIVQNLRDFARLDRAEYDRVDINAAVSGSVEMLRGRLNQSQIAVEAHYGELPQVSCAPAQLNQVFLNLLVNAIQAIEATSIGSGQIEVRTRASGSAVIVEIADNGCGISGEVLPRIFDPFFTTKPVGTASGLGLSISHGIVADHGGQIEVESTPGKGARFRIILPIDGNGAAAPGA